MGGGTQYTVNNQMVNATLMNIADSPTNVQLPGVYKTEEIPRVPIICTGVYHPLSRGWISVRCFPCLASATVHRAPNSVNQARACSCLMSSDGTQGFQAGLCCFVLWACCQR